MSKQKKPLAILAIYSKPQQVEAVKKELKSRGYAISTVIKDGPYIEIHGTKKARKLSNGSKQSK